MKRNYSEFKPVINVETFKFSMLKNGMGAPALAKEAGISKATMYAILRGAPCTIELAFKIAEILKGDITELFTI